MATTTANEGLASDVLFGPAAPFVVQFRKFLWLASGMFSTSSLALAFGDYFTVGPGDQVATHFVGAVIAAGLFALATLLKLGPDEA